MKWESFNRLINTGSPALAVSILFILKFPVVNTSYVEEPMTDESLWNYCSDKIKINSKDQK